MSLTSKTQRQKVCNRCLTKKNQASDDIVVWHFGPSGWIFAAHGDCGCLKVFCMRSSSALRWMRPASRNVEERSSPHTKCQRDGCLPNPSVSCGSRLQTFPPPPGRVNTAVCSGEVPVSSSVQRLVLRRTPKVSSAVQH